MEEDMGYCRHPRSEMSLSTTNFCTQWYFPAVLLKSASGVHALIAKWWIPGISGNKLPAVWVEVFKCLLFFIIQVVSPSVTPAREQGYHMYRVTWLANMKIVFGVGFIWWRHVPGSWAYAGIALAVLGGRFHPNALIYRIYTEPWHKLSGGGLLVWLILPNN